MNRNGGGFWPRDCICSNAMGASLLVHPVMMAAHGELNWPSVNVHVAHQLKRGESCQLALDVGYCPFTS